MLGVTREFERSSKEMAARRLVLQVCDRHRGTFDLMTARIRAGGRVSHTVMAEPVEAAGECRRIVRETTAAMAEFPVIHCADS